MSKWLSTTVPKNFLIQYCLTTKSKSSLSLSVKITFFGGGAVCNWFYTFLVGTSQEKWTEDGIKTESGQETFCGLDISAEPPGSLPESVCRIVNYRPDGLSLSERLSLYDDTLINSAQCCYPSLESHPRPQPVLTHPHPQLRKVGESGIYTAKNRVN